MFIDLSNQSPREGPDPNAVARRLVGLRGLRGLTQEQLAEQAGVASLTVWRAENGKFSANTLVKLNRVLLSSLDYILFGIGGEA